MTKPTKIIILDFRGFFNLIIKNFMTKNRTKLDTIFLI